MEDQEQLLVDPNQADEEELTRLPGVGPALAARIVAARPFASPEEMTRVPGIGPKFLDKILPHLAFPSPEDGEGTEAALESAIVPVPEPDGEAATPAEVAPPAAPPETEPGPDGEAVALTEVEPPAAPPETEPEPEPGTASPPGSPAPASQPRYLTAGQAVWIAFISGLFAFVLAVALTLGLLVSLNGGLRYATDARAAALSTRIEDLQSQAAALDENMAALRTRMDNLETLSGRVTVLEDTSEQLGADFEALSAEVEAFGAQMEELSGQIGSLQEDSLRYQSFLNGLYDFLRTFVEEAPNE